MILTKLSIINYRNLQQVEVNLSPSINCFIGHNGEGKTNLLDAIYYLSFCRSSSNPTDTQLICHGQEFFSLEGTYTSADDNIETISCGFKRGHGKFFKRNKKAYKRLSQHIGLIPLILVTPQDALLIEAGSELRRKFIDTVISQYDPTYVEHLANYNKALAQRNALLKQETPPDTSLLEIWEQEMATNGEALFTKRNNFITQFIPYFQRIYADIAAQKEDVSITYTSHAQRGPLLHTIQHNRQADLAVGHSLHGIHRDDLILTLNGYNIKYEGSQGQNKTLILAMKLAQFEFLRQTISHTTPLLLLDDIFDKLDARRVEAIISLVASDTYGQIFITDTNRDHLDHILQSTKSGYSLFNVEKGTISKI